tara:strand:+ start:264 stop:1028 length:765 start_codon:yes stop_codon:yes gene_type:complete
MNKIYIFDLDGTLTDARSEMTLDFRKLFSLAIDREDSICIATGSDIEYVKEQCHSIIDLDITYYCCNGSKVYKKNENNEICLIKETKMTDVVSQKSIDKLLEMIANRQRIFEKEYFNISKEKIQNRSSMINWCPIGRKSDQKNRSYFVSFDKREMFRDKTVKYFKQMFLFDRNLKKFDIKKGGQTSFDIYPIGMDKSQIFKELDINNIWFWGDKCTQDGNDWPIYSKIHEDRRFNVSNPEDTFKSFQKILDKYS